MNIITLKVNLVNHDLISAKLNWKLS